MSLHCADGSRATLPPWVPTPPRERGAPWSPPDTSRDRCLNCGLPAWQHRVELRPFDALESAIYAAAFVAAMQVQHATPESAVRAVTAAEQMVEIHRRARSGT